MVGWDLTWWLCGLRVEPSQSGTAGIAYRINLSRSGAGERSTNLVTLLRMSPTMLQLGWAPRPSQNSMPENAVHIWNPEAFADARESQDQTLNVNENSISAKLAREALVWRCYPRLNDLLMAAELNCHCSSCKHGHDPNTKRLNSGSLMFYTNSIVLALLAYSITTRSVRTTYPDLKKQICRSTAPTLMYIMLNASCSMWLNTPALSGRPGLRWRLMISGDIAMPTLELPPKVKVVYQPINQ
jgi:hypothetical protein